jgi:hypothetical protein
MVLIVMVMVAINDYNLEDRESVHARDKHMNPIEGGISVMQIEERNRQVESSMELESNAYGVRE